MIKKLLRPLYYSYTGYQVFVLSGRLTGYKKEKQRFFSSLGYYPDLKNPQSFNEKVLWKKIYDRNPFLPIASANYFLSFLYVLPPVLANHALLPH